MIRQLIHNALAMLLVTLLQHDVCDATDRDSTDRSQFLIAGMTAERDKVRSGHVLILGERRELGGSLGEDFRVPVRFETMFDHDKHLFRFDQVDHVRRYSHDFSKEILQKWESRKDLPQGVAKDGKHWVTVESGGSLVRTPLKDMFFPLGGAAISTLPPGVISGTMVQDFDVLALGMSPGVDFDSGRFIGQILADFGRTRFNQITTDADSITRYLYSISTYNGELWVDESHGMSPIRFTFQHRELKEKNFKSCQVDWKEIEGVWVPASCSMEETRSGVTQTYHLTLDWQLVNKPLDPEFFTAAGLVRDENVFVIDSRLGKPVIEPAIAILDPIAIAMATPKTVPSNPSHRLLWFILGNIALFGFVFWLFRRRRKRGTQ